MELLPVSPTLKSIAIVASRSVLNNILLAQRVLENRRTTAARDGTQNTRGGLSIWGGTSKRHLPQLEVPLQASLGVRLPALKGRLTADDHRPARTTVQVAHGEQCSGLRFNCLLSVDRQSPHVRCRD